jgi:GNAT superfamily N-acetyltransferase
MSFWALTPNVTQWNLIENIWKEPRAPYLLDEKPAHKLAIHSKYKITNCLPSASTEYSLFLKKYFSKSSEWILQLPPDLIANGIRLFKWVAVEARTNDGELIGVIFSIPFDEFYAPGFQSSPLKNLGLVDYFCVHPSWRRSGVGTGLLHKLFATTKLFGRKAHVFASEGSIFTLFHKVPPFVKNSYIWRERETASPPPPPKININKFEKLPYKIPNNSKIFVGTNTKTAETTDIIILTSPTDPTAYVLVKPTYELKNNKPVGEIITWWENHPGICDIMLDSLKIFDIYVAPSNFQHTKKWNKGATFAYYAFHFNPAQFDGKQFVRLF